MWIFQGFNDLNWSYVILTLACLETLSWKCSYSIAMSQRVRLADVQFDMNMNVLVWIIAAWTCNVSKSNWPSTSNCQVRTLPTYTVLNYPTIIPYCSPVTLRRPGREHWEMDAKQQLRQVRGVKRRLSKTGWLNTSKKNGSWTAPFCKTSNFM